MEKKQLAIRDRPSMAIPDARSRLVIGLDFGTTWSGVAWALENCPGDIEVIQSWPGGGNRTTEKVPSLLSYDGSKIAWGHQIDPFGDRSGTTIQGVKLLLDEIQKYRYEPAVKSQQLIGKMGKKPVDVVGDYLRCLVGHASEVLNRRFSTALQTMDLHYILTVPAVWSDKAKDATMRAAHLAGINASDLTLLSEPEAAAVYAIQTIQPNSITNDDCLIVCDAGGGTVDIITYCIKQAEPLRFAEVTEGTGAVCGSVMLDERFEELVKQTFESGWKSKLPQSTLNAAKQYWQDYIKPQFRGPVDEDGFEETPYRVPLPGLNKFKGANFHEGFWYMENALVVQIFDPIVKQIEDLIANQWIKVKDRNLSTKAIVLVGGLGSSEYVFRRLQAAFTGIDVMQPKNAWSAVVRGAVYRGLEGNQVDNRVARYNYGIVCRQTVRKGYKNAVWCKYEEEWKCHDCMSWFIKKGMPLNEENPIILPFYRVIGEPVMKSQLVFRDKLHFNMSSAAPDNYDESVATLCELEADLSKIPTALFDKCRNSKGEIYYKVNFQLKLVPASASLLFELLFNGISYGMVRSRY